MNITSEIIMDVITVICSIIAIGLSVWSLIETKKHNQWDREAENKRRKDDLDKQLARILEITIEYPYLESPSFTKKWEHEAREWRNDNKYNLDEKYMRYDQFCNILFNFLSNVHAFYKGNRKEIEDYIDVKNWVRLHGQIWNFPLMEGENADAYSEEFRKYINSYIQS